MFPGRACTLWMILLVIGSSLVASENYRFGVQTHFGQFYRADMDSADVIVMLDSLQAAGVRLIRDECYRADVERDSGHYRFPAEIDFYVQSAADRDIEVLMLLDYNNPLYAPHAGSGIVDDSNRVAFARYCRQVIDRYAPMGVHYYEIWNEPNIPIFWHPEPDPGQYALLLKSVYNSVKKEHPEITLLGCSTSPAEGNEPPFKENVPILLDEEMIDWHLSSACADIDSTGVLTGRQSGTGELIARFQNAQFTHSVTVLPAYEEKEIISFESLQHLQLSFQNFLPQTFAGLCDSMYTTAPTALEIGYQMQYISKRRHRISVEMNLTLIGEPKALLLDFHNNGQSHFCRFRIEDRTGQAFSTDAFTLKGRNGWETIVVPLSKPEHYLYPLRLTDLWIYIVQSDGQKGETYMGNIFIDNLRITADNPAGVSCRPESPVEEYILIQNYPNPFNGETTFHLYLPRSSQTSLILYNLRGREIERILQQHMPAGRHEIKYSASHLASAVYMYRLQSGDGIQQGKLLLLK